MNDAPWLAKSLWELANLITGFSIAQTLAFAYKMADPTFAAMIDNRRAKTVIGAATALSFAAYLGVFVWLTHHLSALDAANAPIYREAVGGRIALALLLLVANLAALFGRQILLGGWLFGFPHPTQIAAATAGPVTVIGRATISAAGMLRLADRSGDVDVPVGCATAEQLARSGALGRVIVAGRLDARGRLTATRIVDAHGRDYSIEQD